MKRVSVISKKYDGSLREEYEAFLYAVTDEAITLFSPPGQPCFDYRKAAHFTAPDGIIEIYPRNKNFNVFHIVEDISHRNRIYVNVALPATLSGRRVVWTDLDIDYRLHPDNTVEQLDQDEFAYNARHMGYPQALVEQVEAACQEVEKGLASQTYPFDHEQQVALYRRLERRLRR